MPAVTSPPAAWTFLQRSHPAPEQESEKRGDSRAIEELPGPILFKINAGDNYPRLPDIPEDVEDA
jgi:hypothetical protein